MSQTVITQNQGRGIAGMLADMDDNYVVTGVQAEASAEMPFGVVVAEGTNPGDCILPASSGAVLKGVVLHSHQYSVGTNGELGTTGIKPKAQLNIVHKGTVLMLTETAVVPGDRVFVRYAAGAGGTQLGAVRNATVASEMIDATKQARFMSKALAGGLAVVRWDITNKP